MMATPADMLRDLKAQRSVLREYARTREQLCELQQTSATTKPGLAYLAGDGARIVLKAREAELTDPEPLPFAPCCGWCRARTKDES